MTFSQLTQRLDTDSSYVWDIHDRARRRLHAGEDVILLSVGDPDFDTPSAITEHAYERILAGRTRYGPAAGDPALRETIAEQHQRHTGQAVTRDNVVVFPGAQNALYSTMMCIAELGDEVIVPEPRYVTYDGVVAATGAQRIDVPLSASNSFRLDVDDLAREVSPRTRAILLNTPHNPTGMMFSRDELEQIAAIAKEHSLWVVSDEVYADITFGAEHVSIAGLDGMAERAVTISSVSKSHAMQGWRLGWAVAPKTLVPHLVNLIMCMLFGTPPFVQDAARFALTHELDETKRMKSEYLRRRELVCARINNMAGLRCTWPDGGMFLLVDVRDTGLTDNEFAEALLEHEGVCVLPAASFGRDAEGHVRVSLTAPFEQLESACNRIDRFMRSR